MAVAALRATLQRAFPPVRAALAYGSAVFAQPRAAPAMVDCVLAVDDAAQWHAQNMARNPAHYPALLRAFPRILRWMHRRGAGIVYLLGDDILPLADGADASWPAGPPEDALVTLNAPGRAAPSAAKDMGTAQDVGVPRPRALKYGVVETAVLLDDLRHWRTLFLAGRLHKPVAAVHVDAALRPALASALAQNRRAALDAALLQCPRHVAVPQLLATVAALSYTGDPRVGVAEDPHKVRSIVAGQGALLLDMYGPLLETQPSVLRVGGGRILGDHDERLRPAPTDDAADHGDSADVAHVLQDTSAATMLARMASLPRTLGLSPHASVAAGTAAADVARAVARVVRGPAIVQALLGILSVGPWRALLYVLRKVLRRVGLR